MDIHLEHINQLLPLHQRVAGFNPALSRLYPIAIIEGEEFLIYDYVDSFVGYQFQKKAPLPMPVPEGVRAAFPLEAYGGRIACVVTPEIFDTLKGYVTILHEFVHCYQFETCEQALKIKLDIARQAQEKGDFMWEIQHPFPYQAGNFTRVYQMFLIALNKGSMADVLAVRKELRSYLGRHDFEYMLWQEWKEGFARWIENRVQELLGLDLNLRGLLPPFSRVTFYAGGAQLVNFLHVQDSSVVNNLEQLFHRMSMPMILN